MAARTDNSVVIGAPLDAVWELTNELERWTELFAEYQSVEILERRGDTVRFRLTMHPDEQGTVHSWVSERTRDPANHVVRARRIETGPFQHMNLRWEYEPVDGGTALRWVQEFTMKPEAPVDDATAARMLDERTRTEMAHVKAAVERLVAVG